MMGDADITSEVYSNKKISIPSVNGNINIAAKANNEYGWASGAPYTDVTIASKKTIDTTDGSLVSSSSSNVTETYLPCYGASGFQIVKDGFAVPFGMVGYYDVDKNMIEAFSALSMTNYNGGNPEFINEIPIGAYYFRTGSKKLTDLTSDSVITPYRYEKLTESTAIELNTYYEAVKSDDLTYFMCYGANNVRVVNNADNIRRNITFYDADKTKISQTGNTNNLCKADIPDDAMYFSILNVSGVTEERNIVYLS